MPANAGAEDWKEMDAQCPPPQIPPIPMAKLNPPPPFWPFYGPGALGALLSLEPECRYWPMAQFIHLFCFTFPILPNSFLGSGYP